jgi:hypothetical protein
MGSQESVHSVHFDFARGPAWVPISKFLSVFKFKLGTEKQNVQN